MSLQTGYNVIATFVACFFAYQSWQAGDRAAEATARLAELEASIASYSAALSGADLVLSTSSGQPVPPERVNVRPVWSVTSGIDLNELVGADYDLPISERMRGSDGRTITVGRVVERLCEMPENVDRCQTSPPARIRVDVYLLGQLSTSDELPLS